MSFDADAQDHIDAKIAVDGFMWPHVQEAINRFVVGCKADPSPFAGVSNWDAIKACCLLAGAQSFAGALVPLKGPLPTSFNFTANDYSPAMGLKGNGGPNRINSNRAGTEDPQNNCHLMLYITERNTASTSAGFAGQDSTTSTSQRAIMRHNGLRANSTTSSGSIRFDYVGAIGASRASSSVFQSLVDGALQSYEIESSEPTSANIAIFARNVGGATGCDARIAFYSIGESVDLELLAKRVARYMQEIAMPTRMPARPIMSIPVERNTTDNRARVRIYDNSGLPWSGLAHNAAGLQIWYTPLGGSPVQITLSSGNWTERKHGWYEVAVPDSAYTGTAPLQFSGEIEGGTVEGPEHVLVGYDPLAPAVGAATAEQAGEIIERLTPAQSTEVDKVA